MRRLLTWAAVAAVVFGLAGHLRAQFAVEDPFGPKEESIAEPIDKVRSAWPISRPKALERLGFVIAQRTESRDGAVRTFRGSKDDERAILEFGFPTVSGFLSDKNPKVRAEAVSCLATMLTPFPHEAKNIVPKLTVALKDPDAEVRRRAACELGMVADNVDWWLSASSSDHKASDFPPGDGPTSPSSGEGKLANNVDVDAERRAILEVYADAACALVNALTDSNRDVRFQSAMSLTNVCRLANGDRAICRELAGAIPRLIDGLGDADSSVRGACLHGLSALSLDREGASYYADAMPRAVPPVVRLLDDPDHPVRVSAISTLGNMAYMSDNQPVVTAILETAPLVMDRLDDESMGIRATAAGALGSFNVLYPLSEPRHRLAEIPQALARVAANDEDEGVRREASHALSAWKWNSKTSRRIDGSSPGEDSGEHNRAAVLNRDYRGDDKPAERDAESAIAAPIGFAVREDRYVPSATKINPPSDSGYRFVDSPETSPSASERPSGKNVGAMAVPVLAKALSDPDPNIRRHAAEQLGRLGSAARPAAEQLLRIVGDENERDEVRLAALRAFEAIQEN